MTAADDDDEGCGGERRVRRLAHCARTFADWAGLWAPAGEGADSSAHYLRGRIKPNLVDATLEAAGHVEACLVDVLLLVGPDMPPAVRQALPGLFSFYGPFLALMEGWGFRVEVRGDRGQRRVTFPDPGAGPLGLSVGPVVWTLLDRAATALESVGRAPYRPEGRRPFVLTPEGPVPLAGGRWRTIRADPDARPATIAFEGETYEVEPYVAAFVRGLIDSGGVASFPAMVRLRPALLKGLNSTRVWEDLPPPVKVLIGPIRGYRFLG